MERLLKTIVTGISVVAWVIIAVIAGTTLGLLIVTFIPPKQTAPKATTTTSHTSPIKTPNEAYNQMYRDIMFNESRGNDTIVNEVGATGHLQYTQIRVNGINELFGTDYILEDFKDSLLSYKVFIRVQMVRNPQADWEYGIRDWATPSNHYDSLTSARMEVIKGRERK